MGVVLLPALLSSGRNVLVALSALPLDSAFLAASAASGEKCVVRNYQDLSGLTLHNLRKHNSRFSGI